MTEKEKKAKEKKVKSPAKTKKNNAETVDKTSVKAKTASKSESTEQKKPRTKAAKTKELSEPATTVGSSGPQRVPSKAMSAPVTTKETTPVQTPAHHEIAQLAHRFWRERGGHHGSHEQDWFRAEQELRGKAS